MGLVVVLLPGLADLIDGRPSVVWMDADIATNRDVWLAAERLGRALLVEADSPVRYAQVPGEKNSGLDDLLGA